MVFDIVVHDPEETDWDERPETQMPIGEWVSAARAGARPFDLEDEVGIRLVPDDGVPWDQPTWAPLDVLEAMCVGAADRLVAGRPALLRSVVDDVATWLLFEPDADVVRPAVLRDVGAPYARWFPIADPPGWTNPPGAAEELYAYVAANRDRLLRPFDRPAAELPTCAERASGGAVWWPP